MIRAVLLSDLHFGGEDVAALAAAAAHIHEFAPDLVLVAGDISSTGRRREMRAAVEWLSALGRPVIATPGNHDTPYWNILARLAGPFRRFDKAVVFEKPDSQAAVVENLLTARGAQLRLDWSLGVANPRDVETIARRFEAADERLLRIVMAHHPLLTPPALDDARARTLGAQHAVRRLAAAGADLILSGHLHVPFVLEAEPKTGAWLIGGGTLSHRVRGAPPSFVTFDAHSGGEVLLQMHACTDAGARLMREERLPLRPERLRRV